MLPPNVWQGTHAGVGVMMNDSKQFFKKRLNHRLRISFACLLIGICFCIYAAYSNFTGKAAMDEAVASITSGRMSIASVHTDYGLPYMGGALCAGMSLLVSGIIYGLFALLRYRYADKTVAVTKAKPLVAWIFFILIAIFCYGIGWIIGIISAHNFLRTYFSEPLGGGYQEAKWGMSPEEVTGIMNQKNYTQTYSSDDSMWFQHTDSEQNKTELSFIFYKNQLAAVIHLPGSLTANDTDYSILLKVLSDKYGKPSFTNPFSTECPDIPFSVPVWDDGETQIHMDIADCDKVKVYLFKHPGLAVTYRSHILGDKLSQYKTQKDAEEKEQKKQQEEAQEEQKKQQKLNAVAGSI
jgi:hypothetical protein